MAEFVAAFSIIEKKQGVFLSLVSEKWAIVKNEMIIILYFLPKALSNNCWMRDK
jgi:hypothetical protein